MSEVYSIESIQLKYFNVEYLIEMEDIGSGSYITAVNLYKIRLNKKYLISINRIRKNHRDISISIYNGLVRFYVKEELQLELKLSNF